MTTSLSTPFGVLACNVCHYDMPAVVVVGEVAINRVVYRCRFDATLIEGEWRQTNLSLDRADREDAPFAFNAREKLANAVLPLLAAQVTAEVIAQAKEENRLQRIGTVQGEIAELERKLAEKRQRLQQLCG